jgi:hypothetical protein
VLKEFLAAIEKLSEMVSSASFLWIEPRASGEIRCNAAYDDRHGLMCKWSLGRRDKSPAKKHALADGGDRTVGSNSSDKSSQSCYVIAVNFGLHGWSE